MDCFENINKKNTCNTYYYPAQLRGYIYSIPINASVDTGSSLSFISEEMFQIVSRVTSNIVVSPCEKLSSAADNTTLQTIKTVYVELCLDGHVFTHSFYVTRGLIIPMVLGVDFLLKNRAVLDFESNIISFEEHNLQICFQYNITNLI
ncbi:hypothetical protein RF11_13344 [Thelohanellus kitauei]|uniref:Peptidase A2 domain-containing protein n=1 Tax=Thelohanellus kitauei TaxID=669202 RepID=A0A0C2JC63_THEKT|nr:hypothetical protein RF11_13344 [Thelohanellus kitauei]